MQKILSELAEVIGLPDAIELTKRWGGRELRVPKSVATGDPLALTLGMDTARKLVSYYGGTMLRLPAERNALLDMRNASMLLAHQRGESCEAIGASFGLTRQGVSHTLRKMKSALEVKA